MTNYEQLKADIAAVVRANGIEAITGDRLQQVLTHMVDVLGNDYALAGVASPTTNPPTPDGNTAYIAGTSGTYTYFLDSSYNPLVVPSNCLTALLMYDASAEAWTAYPFGTIAQGTIGTNELADGAVTETKLATALQNKINNAVTLDGVQAITGSKEFTQPVALNAGANSDNDLDLEAADNVSIRANGGTMELSADDDMNINAHRLDINNPTGIDGNLSVIGDINATGDVDASGDIKATGKVYANINDELATKSYTDTQLATKQDTIADLDTIRAGAALGATAYQKPSEGIPESDLSASVQTSLGKADTALQSFKQITSEGLMLASVTEGGVEKTIYAPISGEFKVHGVTNELTTYSITGFTRGRVYRLRLISPQWDASGMDATVNLFVLGYKVNNTTIYIEQLKVSEAAKRKSSYVFAIPDIFDGYVNVMIRARDEDIPFAIEDVTDLYDVVSETNCLADAFLYKNGSNITNARVFIDNPVSVIVYSVTSSWRFALAEFSVTNLPKGDESDNLYTQYNVNGDQWRTAIYSNDDWVSGSKTLALTISKSSGNVPDVASAFAAVRFYAVKEKTEKKPLLNSDIRTNARIVAHRGFHLSSSVDSQPIPENSIDAFEMAAKIGFKYVETDIHPTSDGVNMVLHDASLNRTMKTSSYGTISGTVNLASLTYSQVRSGYVLASSDVNMRRPLPSFEEFLVCCYQNNLFPIVELKENLHTTTSITNAYNLAMNILGKGNFAFISFSAAYLTTARGLDADLLLVWICRTSGEMAAVPRVPQNVIFPWTSMTYVKSDFDALHAAGLQYMLYPDTIAPFDTMLNTYQADWLITNWNAPDIKKVGRRYKGIDDFVWNGTKVEPAFKTRNKCVAFNNGQAASVDERVFVETMAFQIRIDYEGTFTLVAPNLSTTITSGTRKTAYFNGMASRCPFNLVLTSTANGSKVYDIEAIYTEN